jgi:hypothetical protein
MIGETHPLHTHRRSFSYIYNAIQHLPQWLVVIRMQPHTDICSRDLRVRVNVVGLGGGSLLVLLIEYPHSFHTHIRSSIYIYNATQHLLQWLQVIRMLTHPYICPLGPESESGCCWSSRWAYWLLVVVVGVGC